MTDWPVKTLGDVCDVIAGQSPEGKFYNKEGKGVPFYQGKKDFAERVLGSPTTWTSEVTKLAQPGDILMSVRAPVGPVNLCPIEACIGRGLAAIRPSSKTDTDFIYYYLESIQSEIAGTEGAVFASINKAQIEGLRCPVPPLEEQKRIVALLDAATARVTELTACYELASSHAKLLSGSMLVELLTSVEDSEPMRLGDVAELKGRIGWRGLTAKEYTKEGPLFVSVHSLNYGHFVDLKDAFHISQERYDESPEIMLKNNDILICKDGAGIGKLGMVGQLPGPATINSSLLLIRASKKVRSEFLYFYLLSPIFQNLVQERLSGSTTPHLYQRDIAELVINLPSLETQDQLIKNMWGALGRQGDLVQCFDKQIGAMMRMRQSILESAFAGDL